MLLKESGPVSGKMLKQDKFCGNLLNLRDKLISHLNNDEKKLKKNNIKIQYNLLKISKKY